MKAEVLVKLARFGPLAMWSGACVLLAIAVSIHYAGFWGIDWPLFIVGSVVALLLQYVAHPMNDLVDYAVDVKANIEGTGRDKTLISGLATAKDLKMVVVAVLGICAVLSAIVVAYRPLALGFGLVGFIAVAAYNLPPLKLSYHPFSEPLIVFLPSIAMVMGLTYVATHEIIWLALIAGVVQALIAVSILTSYFAMDVQSDLWGGKNSTVARFPSVYWSTFWPILGLAVSVILVSFYHPVFIASGLMFVVMGFLGLNVDEIRTRYMAHVRSLTRVEQFEVSRGNPPRFTMDTWNRASAAMRVYLVQQVKVGIVHGIVLAALIIVFL